jgi:uncharacterized protein YggL (DUF469 family)
MVICEFRNLGLCLAWRWRYSVDMSSKTHAMTLFPSRLCSRSVFFQTIAVVPLCCWQLDGCPDQQKHIRNIACEGTHLCWSKISEKYGCDRRQVWRRRTGLVGVKRNSSWCVWLANRNFRTFCGSSLFLNLAVVFVMLGHLKAVYCYEARRAGHVKTGHCGKVTRTRRKLHIDNFITCNYRETQRTWKMRWAKHAPLKRADRILFGNHEERGSWTA